MSTTWHMCMIFSKTPYRINLFILYNETKCAYYFSMLLYLRYIRPLQKMNASFKDNVYESHIIAHYGMNS